MFERKLTMKRRFRQTCSEHPMIATAANRHTAKLRHPIDAGPLVNTLYADTDSSR
jgi:hypothetical protein